MASYKGIVVFFVLCTVFATVIGQVSQGGSHENQGRVRRQAEQTGPQDGIPELNRANWTTCDYTTAPAISCHDCSTRLICKPIGGLLKSCYNPMKPFCNNGICSAVPSAECA